MKIENLKKGAFIALICIFTFTNCEKNTPIISDTINIDSLREKSDEDLVNSINIEISRKISYETTLKELQALGKTVQVPLFEGGGQTLTREETIAYQKLQKDIISISKDLGIEVKESGIQNIYNDVIGQLKANIEATQKRIKVYEDILSSRK